MRARQYGFRPGRARKPQRQRVRDRAVTQAMAHHHVCKIYASLKIVVRQSTYAAVRLHILANLQDLTAASLEVIKKFKFARIDACNFAIKQLKSLMSAWMIGDDEGYGL